MWLEDSLRFNIPWFYYFKFTTYWPFHFTQTYSISHFQIFQLDFLIIILRDPSGSFDEAHLSMTLIIIPQDWAGNDFHMITSTNKHQASDGHGKNMPIIL